MTESRLLDLMHGEIDGENSPGDSAALRECLLTDPAAREAYAELQQLAGALDRMQVVDPPADFTESVLNSIRSRRRDPGRQRLGIGVRPAGLNSLKFAYAAAAGLILGVLLAPFILDVVRGGKSPDLSQLPGAMIRQDAFRDAVVVDRTIEAAGVSGRIQLRRSAALLLIDLEIHSGQAVDVTLDYDPDQLAFRGVENSDDTGASFQASRDRLAWTQLSRLRCRILITCTGRDIRPIRVQVLSSGRSVYMSLLPVPGLIETKK